MNTEFIQWFDNYSVDCEIRKHKVEDKYIALHEIKAMIHLVKQGHMVVGYPEQWLVILYPTHERYVVNSDTITSITKQYPVIMEEQYVFLEAVLNAEETTKSSA